MDGIVAISHEYFWLFLSITAIGFMALASSVAAWCAVGGIIAGGKSYLETMRCECRCWPCAILITLAITFFVSLVFLGIRFLN